MTGLQGAAAPASSRPGCRSSMSTSAMAKDKLLRRRLFRPQRQLIAGISAAAIRGARGAHRLAARWPRQMALHRRTESGSPRRRGSELARCRSGWVSDENGFPGVRPRPFRRDQFGGLCGDGGRRARQKNTCIRSCSLWLHLNESLNDAGTTRRAARRPLRHRSHRSPRQGFGAVR